MEFQAMCCPSPSASVIQPIGKARMWRKALLFAIYAEVASCIIRMVLFGTLDGLLNLIGVWILYLAYATMHFCQTMVVIFSGILDIVMLAMSWQKR